MSIVTRSNNLIYKDECLCLYLIQIHISDPIGTKLRTRLPRGLEETVGYVWAHNIAPSPTFRTLPLRRPAWRCANMAPGATRHPPKRYIREPGTCSCDVTHTSSRRTAYSYCANRTLWVVRRKLEEDNGTHTRVNVETGWHCGEPKDYTDLPTLTVTCVCVSLACVFTFPL